MIRPASTNRHGDIGRFKFFVEGWERDRIQKHHSRRCKLAYALSEEHWGKGLVAEASRAMMDYCFKEFSLKRIQARCKVENKASARVMEKAGMIYEGTLRSAIFHRDRYWDMHYYAKVIEG